MRTRKKNAPLGWQAGGATERLLRADSLDFAALGAGACTCRFTAPRLCPTCQDHLEHAYVAAVRPIFWRSLGVVR